MGRDELERRLRGPVQWFSTRPDTGPTTSELRAEAREIERFTNALVELLDWAQRVVDDEIAATRREVAEAVPLFRLHRNILAKVPGDWSRIVAAGAQPSGAAAWMDGDASQSGVDARVRRLDDLAGRAEQSLKVLLAEAFTEPTDDEIGIGTPYRGPADRAPVRTRLSADVRRERTRFGGIAPGTGRLPGSGWSRNG